MPIYREDLLVNLTAAQADANTHEWNDRITVIETNPPQANNITSIATEQGQWVITMTDASTMEVPVEMVTTRDRKAWEPFSLYYPLDIFTVAGSGLFSVLDAHTSAAVFDPDAVGPAVAAGAFVVGTRYLIATVGTTDFTLIGAASNTVGVEFTATGVGSGTGTATPQLYNLIIGVAALAANTTLDELFDVDVTGAAANAMLVAVATGSPAVISWEDRTPAQVTALLSDFVGDTGSPGGGIKGLVPAPADGDAAADKFLHAGGDWETVTSGINQLTGDGTAGPGTGSQALTLANTAVAAGSYTLTALTVDAKGRLTAASNGIGDAISDLPLATLPVAPLSLLEISETDGGSPATYTSKHIRISDLVHTLGSTSIAMGATTTTIAGLTLSGATLGAVSLSLVGPSGIIATDRILSVAYGTVGTPLPTDPSSGGSAASFTVYATPGTGLADAITVALQGDTHLTAGSRGVAIGGVFRGYTSGTWGPDGSFNAGSAGVWAEGHSSRGGVVHGGFFEVQADTTTLTGGGACGLEVDMAIAISTPAKYGLAIVSATGDTGATTSSSTVAISGASVLQSAAIVVQAPIAGGTGFKYGIITIDAGVEQPIQTAGSLWRAGGFTTTNGLDWPDMTFSGNAIKTPGFTVDGAGNLTAVTYKIGAIQIFSNDGSYTYFRNGSGTVDAILLGPTGDPSNYYDRTNHVFRGNGGSGTHATITSAGLTIPLSTPASASAAGVVGTIKWDADFIYVCVATNTWERVAIATW